MIKKFSFKNYKAFEKGEIELKPITILLGVNSVGKSSILQFLLMLEQTLNSSKPYRSALKLNGEHVSLGENENIFHNHKVIKPIEFTVTTDSIKLDNILYDYINKLNYTKSRLIGLVEINNALINTKYIRKQNNRSSNYSMLQNKFENFDLDQDFSEIEILIKSFNKELKNYSILEEDKTYLLREIITNSDNFIRCRVINNTYKASIGEFKDIYKILKSLKQSNVETSEITISYEISNDQKNNKLYVSRLSISNNDQNILTYKYNNSRKGRRFDLFSDIISNTLLAKYSADFGKTISFDRLMTCFSPSREINTKVSVVEYLSNIFNIAIRQMQQHFSNSRINYVSPLRAFPKRYYFLDTSNVSNSLNTIDGNQLTEILNENKKVRNLVNIWLEKFNLKLDVDRLKDVIHKIKIRQHGLNLDITDVGFGISQVLPVIVQGFLSKSFSITIIEQPEIHLHPKMQSELADLFIDIIMPEKNNVISQRNGKVLIIETHSEYLLKKLRLRIAEGKLSKDDVKIYFIHQRSDSSNNAVIEDIEISESGYFAWPKEFYDDEISDTINFLRYQK